MTIDKTEPVRRVPICIAPDRNAVDAMLDATLTEIYAALKQSESVSLRHFGPFDIQPEGSGCVFKFNPLQRMRKLLGGSSTYQGEV